MKIASKAIERSGATRANGFKRGFGVARSLRVGAMTILASLACTTMGQQTLPGGGTNPNPPQNIGRGFGHDPINMANDEEGYDPAMMERRIRAVNIERQKQMVSDTNKLLKLAKELNDEVATSNVGSFTPDQLRKIAEIEKLARNVKDRMTAGMGQIPGTLPPPPSLIYPGRPQ